MRISPGQLSLADLRQVYRAPISFKMTGWRSAVARSAALVARISRSDQPTYGINTGFGKLAQTHIAADSLEQLQRNLIVSHCVGVGEPLADEVVRLLMVLKLASLAQGFSGVRVGTIDALQALFDAQAYPVIPSQGSVGASGDLAPLAHLTAALMGIGEIRLQGRRLSARVALKRVGLAPIKLAAKEGLALINGTQVSTALALAALFDAEAVFAAALVAGAMSVDAAAGSDTPFDDRIHRLRRQPGQIAVAAAIRTLLAGSGIRESHRTGDPRVQDPYSLRCQPQVMGACLDQLEHAAQVLLREANAVTDNPLVFADDEQVLSGGNFHAEPVALVADAMANAIAEIGALSERRIALLIDANLSGLPPFLVPEPGLNSGFMIAHVTAASLASENKSLAHPASVDSLPTSANQEDHVSMATFAARRLHAINANVRYIVAIELLAAAQGIDFRAPLRTSAPLRRVLAQIRQRVDFYARDRLFAPDIEAIALMVQQQVLLPWVEAILPSFLTEISGH